MSAMLRVDGAVVFWSIGEWTSRDAIINGWKAVPPSHGIYDWFDLAPQPRTNLACLRGAVNECHPKNLIRMLEKRDGFAVLEEKRYTDEVITNTIVSYKINDQGGIDVIRGWTADREADIRSAFAKQTALLKPSQVASALTDILRRMNAVTLRPTGGVYWLSDEYLDTWGQLTAVIEAASVGARNTVYRITHQFDAHSVRAVRDAFLAEVEKEANKIMEEVDAGELGENALKNRATQAEILQDKVREFERILGERLPDAADLARKAELTAMAAKILAVGAA